MKEYVTEALVLGVKNVSGYDRVVDLFTRELGRLNARTIGARKTLSKFSPHLDILNLVVLRLVKKNAFTVSDVLTKNRFPDLRNGPRFKSALDNTAVIKNLLPQLEPDLKLWHECVTNYNKGMANIRETLKILGYDPRFASCESCGDKKVTHFSPVIQNFVCRRCNPKFNDLVTF